MIGPIDLAEARRRHIVNLAAERDDGSILHASDHGACDYATWLRLHGVAHLPYNAQTVANFERGLAYETPFFETVVVQAEAQGLRATLSPQVGDQIVGHPDILLWAGDKLLAVIDPTTTASKGTNWRFSHAIKSAAYADELGCDLFCEWVHHFGWIGDRKAGENVTYGITESEEHWFHLDHVPVGVTGSWASFKTWRELVAESTLRLLQLRAAAEPPMMAPPVDPITLEPEAWRCRAYCEAHCHLNQRYSPEVPL